MKDRLSGKSVSGTRERVAAKERTRSNPSIGHQPRSRVPLSGNDRLSLSDDEEETYRKKQGFHTDEMEEAIRCGPRGGGANRR